MGDDSKICAGGISGKWYDVWPSVDPCADHVSHVVHNLRNLRYTDILLNLEIFKFQRACHKMKSFLIL